MLPSCSRHHIQVLVTDMMEPKMAQVTEKMEKLESENANLRKDMEVMEKETRTILRELSKVSASHTGLLTATEQKAAGASAVSCAYQSFWDLAGAVITFERLTGGDGGLLDLASGKFTAPVAGLFTAVFSGVAFLAPGENVFIYLRKNGEALGFEARWQSTNDPAIGGRV